MRKINKELWLLLSLVLIAAMIHFLVASQAVALVFYFLPTLYSAYHFGRRHATLTACASVCLVVLLTYVNPSMFNHRMDYVPLDSRWFDITVWGGVLVVTAYAMGTLYERNQKSVRELKNGYDGMLVILQQFLVQPEKQRSRFIPGFVLCEKIAEALGLDPESSEDLRTAALLRNVNEIGISNEILYKAANSRRKNSKEACARERAERHPGPAHGWIAASRDSHPGGGPAVARDRRQSSRLHDRSADPESGGEV